MSRGLQEAVQTLCERGHLERALDVLSHLHLHPHPHLHAPISSYISLFTACSKSRALETTRLLHAHLYLLGNSVSSVAGQHLVVALAKCGAVDDALHVSCSLSQRTVVSWTAIISAFASSCYGTEALKVYQCMLEDGIEPDRYTFASLFKACGSIPDLLQGRAVHADARQCGFVQEMFMASTLITMYSKCGSIGEAENVFDALEEYDIVTWNAMIAAYVEHGEKKKALETYLMMEGAGFSPNDRTYVSALQVCAMFAEARDVPYLYKASIEVPPLHLGQVLHANTEKKGCTLNAFVGNCLLSMYGRCGAIVEAEYVFTTLRERTGVSWNAMLSAFVSQGRALKALGVYVAMVSQGVSPDQLTLVSVFQACAILAEKGGEFLGKGESAQVSALAVGQALHSSARRRGYMSFAVVCNTLISLYGKCGAIAEAEHVFAAMLHRNTVSWNALFSNFNEQGQGQKTLQLYARMELEGVSPDEGTFVLTIQACAILVEKEDFLHGDDTFHTFIPLHIGYVLHAEAHIKGFTANSFVTSTLVSMYGKCGAIVEAEYVFCAESNRTRVVYNAMISSYVTQGQEVSALHLYRQMHEEGVAPDQVTYATATLACATLMEKECVFFEQHEIKEMGRALHADAKRNGPTFNPYVGSSLMSMYNKHGSIAEVEHVFGEITHQDSVSSNTMLSAYVERGMGQEALQFFAQMLKENVTLDHQTLVIAFQACTGISGKEFAPLIQGEPMRAVPLVIAHTLHEHAKNKGFTCNAIVASALVSMYGKLGAITEAEVVFQEILQRTVVTWSAMIFTHVDQGEGLKALHLYKQMQEHCVAPNHITMTSLLQACIEIGSIESCERLHFDIVSVGYDQIPSVSAAIVNAYGTQASMLDAQALLGNLLNADMVSWNACLGGHAGSGDFVASFQVLELSKCVGFQPDQLTLTLVLAACSRAGLVAEGVNYLVSSRRDYKTRQDLKHDATILDLLGRAGDFKRAKDVLEKMPSEAGYDSLLSLLGACRAHGNAELAEEAFTIAMDMEHTQATAYILMSNVYADGALQKNDNYGSMGS